MTTALELLGVFLGGALPWLEAVIVIPIGIVAGLQPVPVVLAALAGNLLTVWLAAYYGERLRTWWRARRGRQRGASGSSSEAPADGSRDASAGPGPHASTGASRPHRRTRDERIRGVLARWGMLGLAVVGPIGLGTQLSAVVAVSLGISARAAFAWVAAGTLGWSVLAAVLTVTGVTFLGVGG